MRLPPFQVKFVQIVYLLTEIVYFKEAHKWQEVHLMTESECIGRSVFDKTCIGSFNEIAQQGMLGERLFAFVQR